LSSDFENVIVLSDEFYQKLIAHPVPNDLESVKVLAESPAVLDLFAAGNSHQPRLTPASAPITIWRTSSDPACFQIV
jgi:hypothetical protein